MTFKDNKLDRDYLEHVQQTDYGAAITDEIIDEIIQDQEIVKRLRKWKASVDDSDIDEYQPFYIQDMIKLVLGEMKSL